MGLLTKLTTKKWDSFFSKAGIFNYKYHFLKEEKTEVW